MYIKYLISTYWIAGNEKLTSKEQEEKILIHIT